MTISTAMSTDSGKSYPTPRTQESALQELLSYCADHSISISSSIAARHFPSRGLGVYTVHAIKKGEQLIHVPTKAMLTTRSIPASFLSKATKKKVSVHCALAMYLAFGDVQGRYGPWMATWPRWEEFAEGMVVFWGQDFRRTVGGETVTNGAVAEGGLRAGKRAKLSDDRGSAGDALLELNELPRFSRSLGVDDYWITIPNMVAAQTDEKKSIHLATQAEKIRVCIDTIDAHFPEIKIRDPASHDAYLRFLHMWACVNTRCFYYLRPGQAPPEDSNEAMALCPFQDLFNHSDAKGCTGVFDKHGFFINAEKDYGEGEELFIKYGEHSNDMLWMEYGFMMDDNRDDAIKIDRVILNPTEFGDGEHLMALEEAGYRGDYTLKNNGVCYRTVVASYLGILDDRQWKRLIAGGFDPDTNTRYALARLQAKQRLVHWIMNVRKEAESNLQVLKHGFADENGLVDALVNEASLTEEQRLSKMCKLEITQRRRDTCVRRWKQIFDMCMTSIRHIENDCPGAFVKADTDGRSEEDLRVNARDFLAGVGRKRS